MNFSVAALPRSGTAWIASVLNLCPDICCVHEPVDCNTHVPKMTYKHTGQSGSHLLAPDYGDVDADYSVYIDRDEDDVFDSIEAIYDTVDEDAFAYMVSMTDEYAAGCDMVVQFDKLFLTSTVAKIWESISELPFEADKVEMMLNMNVQRESLEYDFDPVFLKKLKGDL